MLEEEEANKNLKDNLPSDRSHKSKINIAMNSESNFSEPTALNENINNQVNFEPDKYKDRNKNNKLLVLSTNKNERSSFSYNLRQPTEKFNKKKSSAILPNENLGNLKKTEDEKDERKDNNTFLTAPINDKKIRKSFSERKLNLEKKPDPIIRKEEKTIKEENEQETIPTKSFLQKNSKRILNFSIVFFFLNYCFFSFSSSNLIIWTAARSMKNLNSNDPGKKERKISSNQRINSQKTIQEINESQSKIDEIEKKNKANTEKRSSISTKMKERKTLTRKPKESGEFKDLDLIEKVKEKEKEQLPKVQTQNEIKANKEQENQEQKENVKKVKQEKKEKVEKRISYLKLNAKSKTEIFKKKDKNIKQVLNEIPENHDDNFNSPELIKKNKTDSFMSQSESEDEEFNVEKDKSAGEGEETKNIEKGLTSEKTLNELEEKLRESEKNINSPKKKSTCKKNYPKNFFITVIIYFKKKL